MIFVDTSAWFAMAVPDDRNHQLVNQLLADLHDIDLVTTDYVLDETLTLLKQRREFARARALGRQIIEQSVCRLAWVATGDVVQAWVYFDAYRDKAWSFTDCVSRAVIERLKIPQALAFDEHFREFGSVVVLP